MGSSSTAGDSAKNRYGRSDRSKPPDRCQSQGPIPEGSRQFEPEPSEETASSLTGALTAGRLRHQLQRFVSQDVVYRVELLPCNHQTAAPRTTDKKADPLCTWVTPAELRANGACVDQRRSPLPKPPERIRRRSRHKTPTRYCPRWSLRYPAAGNQAHANRPGT